MEIPVNISPTVALVGILSGIFLFALSMLLFHILLQRRKAKARGRAASRSDSESDLTFEGAEEGDEEEEDEEEKMKMKMKMKMKKGGGRGSGPRASSLYLEPNQPLYVNVDVETVESESDDHRGPAAHAGMQFILTPPTPRR